MTPGVLGAPEPRMYVLGFFLCPLELLLNLIKILGDPRGHGVTLRAFLSPLRHMEQLLLVTSCDSPAGIGASLWTHTHTDGKNGIQLSNLTF